MPLLRETPGNAVERNPDLPLISVIVPACNEESHIAAALESLRAQDYPALEIVVVNDRSTDSTGDIVDRIAVTDRRVRAIHVESLPDGWLGKVHAMHTGVSVARGDWILFTDADVRFQPQALELAMGFAVTQEIDHLTCMPEISESGDFWLEVTIRAFFMMFAVSTRLAAVNREGSRWPVGIGAFNLVRADAFRRTPGFEWLRMEPADDLGLGAMLKKSGARTRLVHGKGVLSVPWYASIGDMIQGLEKNSFGPGANYSYVRQLLIVLLLSVFAIVPALSLVLGLARLEPVPFGAGMAAGLAVLIAGLQMPRRSLRELFAYLFLPLGVLILSWIMLRSAYLCWRNGGVDWRGTHYSIADLRAGQRVRFN